MNSRIYLYGIILGMMILVSCRKNPVESSLGPPGNDTVHYSFDINSITDTYAEIAPFQFYTKWSVYNVHDPTIKKFGDYYYCYSTDVAYGTSVRPGIQVRKSKDLVEWQFVGWALDGLPTEASNFIKQQGGTPNTGIWAPYVLKINNEYRLYYSLSSSTSRLSAIGLLTSSSPEGPWKENGLVVTSENNASVETNAIDPTVLTTANGDQWMYYGSAYDGIYVLKLNSATGFAASQGDKGKRIAQRGFTNGKINGNIEAPEIIYNSQLQKYFLFISYDWLETKYNVRVGRSDNPQGPFYDFNGTNLNEESDNIPMILAPYQFKGHGGWQGTGHCSVFTDDNGQYFIAHQARPAVNKYFMDLHIRKLFWTQDGWPLVSPERFAWEDNSTVPVDSLIGNWEQINLNYHIVPGFQNEQISPDLQTSTDISINAGGALNNDAGNTWTYNAPWLKLKWNNGRTANVFIQKARDWENRRNTIILTGLDDKGTAVWGKKNP